MDDAQIELLKEMPVFGGVSTETLNFLIDSAQRIALKKGEFFFREGETGEALYVLQQGEVAVLKKWREGVRELRRLYPGDSFGEMALFDLYPRSASVQAVVDSGALLVTNDLLFQIYQRDPEQFTLIQMNLAREISRRLRTMEETLFHISMNEEEPDKNGFHYF